MKDTETFLKVLDPEDSSTGGGSAAAISGAMAGALVAMVCRLCAKAPETEDGEAFRLSAAGGRAALRPAAGRQPGRRAGFPGAAQRFQAAQEFRG